MSYVMCALYTYYEALVFINKSKMLVAGQKRKPAHKTLQEKDIEKELSNIEQRGSSKV